MNDYDFIKESNRIEGILRDPTQEEVSEFHRFMDLDLVCIDDVMQFVKVYQSDAILRDRQGLDVRVGSYLPPRGGVDIRGRLVDLLEDTTDINAYKIHLRYEMLHPFTDCNGRSGRMLWAWQMKDISLGFLHRFYYQALRGEQGEL